MYICKVNCLKQQSQDCVENNDKKSWVGRKRVGHFFLNCRVCPPLSSIDELVSEDFKNHHCITSCHERPMPKRLIPSWQGASTACTLAFLAAVASLHCVLTSQPYKCLARALEWVAFEIFLYFRVHCARTACCLIAVCAAEAALLYFPRLFSPNVQVISHGMRSL